MVLDVEDLPLADGNDHRWVAAFCESCRRCIKTCPAGAVLEEPRLLEDGTPVFIDPEKCAVPFSEGAITWRAERAAAPPAAAAA